MKTNTQELDYLRRRIYELGKSQKTLENANYILKESVKNYYLLFDRTPIPYQSLDENGCFLEVNQAWLAKLGYSRDEVIGKWFGDFLSQKCLNHFKKNFPRFKEEGEIQDVELEMLSGDGTLKKVIFQGKIGYHQDGSFKQTHCIFEDISHREEMESALHKSEERFKQVAESAGEWIWEIDADGLYTYSSVAVENIIGYKPHQIVGRKYFYDLIVPEAREKLKKAAFEIFRRRESFHDLKIPNLHKDGTRVISEASGVPIIDEEGRFQGYRGLDNDITDRVKFENALLKSERQLNDIINHLPDATFAIDCDGKVIAWNKAIEDMTGVKASEIVGKGDFQYAIPFYGIRRPILIDLIFKKTEEIDKLHYNNIQQKGQSLMAETSFSKLTGKKLYLWGKVSPLYDEKGKIMGAIESIRDITQRKKAEKALIKSQKHFQDTFDNAPVGIFHTSPDGKIYEINRVLAEKFGYDSIEEFSSFVNKTSLQETVYVNKEDRRQWVREVVADDMWHSYEIPFYRKNHSIITVELTARAVRKSDGSVKYLEGFLEDITERKKAEGALKESEYKFRNLVETTPDMIWEIDLQGVFTYMSPRCQDVMGYTPEDIIGNSIFSVIAPEFVSQARNILQTYIKRNKPFHTFEVLVRHRNGSLITLEIRSIMLKDNEGQLYGFRGVARDITETKKSEEELKKANIYNRSLIEASLDPLVTIGPDGKITDVNQATEAVTGYFRDVLIGTDFSDYFTSPVEARRGYQRVFREGLVKDYPLKIKHKDGLVTPVLYNASVYRDEQGKVSGVFAAARDITELKKTEKKLQESQNKLKIAMNLAKLVHWEYDIESDLFTFDDQFYSLYGTTSKQEGGTTMSSEEYAQRFIPPEEASLVAIETKKAIGTDDPDYQGQLEHTIIRADGEKRYITVRYGVIKDSKGRTVKTYGSNQDITERVEAERNIKDQAELLNLTREAIFVHDLDNKIIFWNDGAAEMYGWKQEEVLGKVTHIILKTTFPEPLDNIIKCLIDKGWWNGELIHTTREGSTIISDSRWTLKKDEKGNPQSILEINTNITQRVNFQRALRESEEKFRAVAETAVDAIVTIDEGGNIIYFNHSLLTMFGYSRDELKSMSLNVLLPEKIRKNHIHGVDQFILSENNRNLKQILKSRGLRKDGKEFPMEISISHWEFEKKPYFTAIIRDITQREQAEEELKRSERKYHSLYSTMSEGMAIHEILYNRRGEPVDYMIIDVNPAYEKILGLNKNQVMERKASQIYGTTKPPYLKIYAAVAHDGEPAQFETIFEPLNKYFRISVTSPEKGKFVTIFDDITTRKKAEDEIKSSLREKELLLQEIHHRVKNNLQIISSLLNLQENYVEEEEAVNVLRESQNRVLSMAMIHEMLYDSEDLSSIDFHGYIQHLVYDLFNSYGITSGYVKPVIKVGDVFLNIETSVPCGLIISELVSNSLKYAFPEVGGVLSVDLHLHGDEYELIIADDGVGLPEDLDFTDTESLGLRLVNSLVRQLDGTIELDKSQGTKFTIKFSELSYKKRI